MLATERISLRIDYIKAMVDTYNKNISKYFEKTQNSEYLERGFYKFNERDCSISQLSKDGDIVDTYESIEEAMEDIEYASRFARQAFDYEIANISFHQILADTKRMQQIEIANGECGRPFKTQEVNFLRRGSQYTQLSAVEDINNPDSFTLYLSDFNGKVLAVEEHVKDSMDITEDKSIPSVLAKFADNLYTRDIGDLLNISTSDITKENKSVSDSAEELDFG